MNVLYDIVISRLSKDNLLEIDFFVGEFLKQNRENILGILFYGSCLRTGTFKDNVADFYIIMSELPDKRSIKGLLGYLLPPNVYYIEVPFKDSTLRAKYGLFTLHQFRKMSSINAFQPYLWARLVQPMQLVYVKNNYIKEEIVTSIINASTTMLFNTLPVIKSPFTVRELWIEAFTLTYKSEIRPEKGSHILGIYEINKDYLENITEAILEILPYPIRHQEDGEDRYLVYISPRLRILKKITWWMRIINGKFMSALRLIKSLLTFKNALQYGYYKLSKHITDVKVPFIIRKNLFLTCGYLYFVGITKRLFKKDMS